MGIADERAEPFKRATWIRYINGVLFEHFEKSEISVDGGGLDRAKNQKSRDFQIDRLGSDRCSSVKPKRRQLEVTYTSDCPQ